MKKTMIFLLSFAFICIAYESKSHWAEYPAEYEAEPSYDNGYISANWEKFKKKAHTLIERDNENYWLNNVRFFKSYPINFYNGGDTKYNDDNSQSHEVATREYKHNVVVSANLGQRMLDSETFVVTSKDHGQLYSPETDISFYNAGGELNISAQDTFAPIGEVKIEGLYYLLFDPKEDGRIIMIDETGRFVHMICRIYKKELIISEAITNVKPKTARAEPTSGIKTVFSKPKFNFELKYDGLQDKKISFLYISDENGGTAQRFTYPETQKVINIYGNKIQIIRPYKDKIEYMILD
ncbi:MAG: hypothetical protein MJ212_00910 [Alphaproteobacteria bacterium]|nr:hypothetical protein [Alphaproteobacteria bacterium]